MSLAAKRSSRPRERSERSILLVRALPSHQMICAADSRIAPAAMTKALDGLHRQSGRTAHLWADPINHLVAGPNRPVHLDKAGRLRAHRRCPPPRSHAPPGEDVVKFSYLRDPALDSGSLDK